MAAAHALRAVPAEVLVEAAVSLPTICVIGLGYVGVVSVGCLAERGFKVIGADLDAAKVACVAEGRSPIVERGLEALLSDGVRLDRVSATRDVVQAVNASDVTLLAVGTPTSADGGCDLTFVRAASRAIGTALRDKPAGHCVILRCSVPPGTTLGVVVPEIEAASGKKLGQDFGICFSPEFLREGSAVADFADPAKVVIAVSDARAEAIARQVLSAAGQPVLMTTIAVAETLKYVDNIWHATKVVFANEVGRFCKALDVDSHEVMRLFVEDTKLNLSPYYLKPGFAFGGACLPKEVRAAMHIASLNCVELPLIDSLLISNEQQVAAALRMIVDLATPLRRRTIGFLGLTFKAGTDDLRESPMVELAARLLRQNLSVRVCDPNLGSGPRLQAQASHIAATHASLAPLLDALVSGSALATLDSVMADCDVIVVAHATEAFRAAVRGRRAGVHVVDLVRLFRDVPAEVTYHGIGW